MKHPVSVEELLELHRLGELFSKWSSNPFSMSEEDLEELQGLAREYSVDGTSALFAFQKQFQQEFNVTVQNSAPLAAAIEQAMDPMAMNRLKEALSNVPTTPLLPEEQTAYIVPIPVREERAAVLAEIAEREAAQREELREDNQIAQEQELEYRAQMHADELRQALENREFDGGDIREIEILREISNVDELTMQESNRLDELVRAQVQKQNSGTHKIPAGVLSEAVSGSSEKGSK